MANLNQTNTEDDDIIPKMVTTKMIKYPHIQPHPFEAADDIKKHRVPANCPSAYNPEQSQSVLRRNARERNRVKQVNNSFARLRQHIPQSIITDLTKGGGRGPQKKISKVDTLRIAVEYIRRLQDLLEDLNAGTNTQQQQQNPKFVSQSSSSFDSTSNSSFSSSSTSSYTSQQNTPAYYTQTPNSPLTLPLLTDTNLQANHLSAAYNNSTTLLSPVSLNSYSPPHQQTGHLENVVCHSPTSSFNSQLSYDTPNFDVTLQQPQQEQEQQKQQQQLVTVASCLDLQQPYHSNNEQAATPPHFDGNFQLKFEPYDNFALDEEDCTPDDEEILDYISLWQEQ